MKDPLINFPAWKMGRQQKTKSRLGKSYCRSKSSVL